MNLLSKLTFFAAAALLSLACAAEEPETLVLARAKEVYSTTPSAEAALSEDTAYTATFYTTIYEGLKNREEEIDLLDCHFPVSAYDPYEFIDFYSLVCHEHPELYYVYANQLAGLTSRGADLYKLTPIYTETDPDVIASTMQQIEAALARLTDMANRCETDAEKVLAVHDALVLETAYDMSLTMSTAKNTLLDHTSVCQGYADAFYAVMERLDIPCAFVSSEAMVHVWNAVQLDGKWYHIDCTFDDATYGDGDIVCACMHKYCLLGNDALIAAGDHFDFTPIADDGDAFDGAPWRGADSRITALAGHLYFTDSDAFAVKRYDTLTGKVDTLADFDALGIAWPYPVAGGVWSSAFSSLEYADGWFFYNSADTIYAVSADGKQTKTVFKASLDSSTSIYGLRIENGKLYAAVGSIAAPFVRMLAEACELPEADARLFAVHDRIVDGKRVLSAAAYINSMDAARLLVFAYDADGRFADVCVCTLPACGATVTLPASLKEAQIRMIVINDNLSPMAPLSVIGA